MFNQLSHPGAPRIELLKQEPQRNPHQGLWELALK